jgi:nuclear transport factor 2 (NTF2) superfamily protein
MNIPVQHAQPPSIATFSAFRTPSGKVWQREVEWDTRDDGCVAIAYSDCGGWVALADTKDPQSPTLFFTKKEWDDFTNSL